LPTKTLKSLLGPIEVLLTVGILKLPKVFISYTLVSFCLKGHTIEVCSLYTDKKNPHLIVSGSMDTNTKIWDLRTKNPISTLKNHHKKVTALNMTPDSKIVISGSEDGVVQTW
jgi:WD40 repeat protein